MIVLPGGRERSEKEYAALFDAAGLRLTEVIGTSTRMSVFEARAGLGGPSRGDDASPP